MELAYIRAAQMVPLFKVILEYDESIAPFLAKVHLAVCQNVSL